MFNLSKLPHNPGCYLMKDTKGSIIYIGKAKDIKKRVSQYFQDKSHDDKTRELVSHIADVDFIITNTEMEALLLESRLIKKHKPKYNLELKDSQRYCYIKLTKDAFPRIATARSKEEEGELYGPYTDGSARRQAIRFIQKKFKLRTCRTMPKHVCLLYHIGRCCGPCAGHIPTEEYTERVEHARLYLKGNNKELILELTAQMEKASASQEFEQAKEARDTIFALGHLSEKQHVDTKKTFDQDIIHYAEKEGNVLVQLFNIKRGMVINKREFLVQKQRGFLDAFVKQFYADNLIPEEIILPQRLSDHALITELLSSWKEKKVMLTVPHRSEKKQLLMMVQKNAEQQMEHKNVALTELKERLNLPLDPQVIECFDISNLGETACVGSMVQFGNGEPEKSNYRHFKIRTVEGQDDFSMIAEVVRRRYSRLVREAKEMPNLIVIDGGIGQLGAATEVLRELGLSIPIISLAKQFEEVHVPGTQRALQFVERSDARKLLQRIRDEAHRFALQYHRLLRSKKMKE